MDKRTKIINDPADLVPLLHTFKDETYMKIFKKIYEESVSSDELVDEFGEDAEEAIEILNSIGLVKSSWGMNGGSPQKLYETSYSKFRANFECELKDIAEILRISINANDYIKNEGRKLLEIVEDGPENISEVSEKLDIKEVLLRAIIRRHQGLKIKGNKLKTKD
ncbi:MAG: ArsR family transcriptional regulator [Candidatus Methanohalarchaeum thermophilum]|uniref:ArsR family transcriptional regulator n=1 Tax=Methanohalarchaeum thermophilum TaxID=1903181 RepID=A0A1Q6DTE4_METT1|nr:MAG: ArsR family transcriptional regulator [Candidatus Methanohalarchaeum thermophilum]